MRFTLAQLRGFTAAAARDERQRLADLASAVRIAFGADAAGWRQYQNLMTGQVPARPEEPSAHD